jgi:hypothetical protein
MLYVPLGVLAATVTIPLASMLNGPVVNGVTLVLVVVAAMLLNVSFVMRSMPLLPYCLSNGYRWIVPSIGLFTTVTNGYRTDDSMSVIIFSE